MLPLGHCCPCSTLLSPPTPSWVHQATHQTFPQTLGVCAHWPQHPTCFPLDTAAPDPLSSLPVPFWFHRVTHQTSPLMLLGACAHGPCCPPHSASGQCPNRCSSVTPQPPCSAALHGPAVGCGYLRNCHLCSLLYYRCWGEDLRAPLLLPHPGPSHPMPPFPRHLSLPLPHLDHQHTHTTPEDSRLFSPASDHSPLSEEATQGPSTEQRECRAGGGHAGQSQAVGEGVGLEGRGPHLHSADSRHCRCRSQSQGPDMRAGSRAGAPGTVGVALTQGPGGSRVGQRGQRVLIGGPTGAAVEAQGGKICGRGGQRERG